MSIRCDKDGEKRGRKGSRSLAELLVGDLEGDIGTTESGGRETELRLEDRRVGVDVVGLGVDLDTLDGGDGTSTLGEDAGLRELLDDGREELMGNAEDDEGSALCRRKREEGKWVNFVEREKSYRRRKGEKTREKDMRTLTHSVSEGTATRLSGRVISGR